MAKKVPRADAINQLVRLELTHLSQAERAEQVSCMLHEDWSRAFEREGIQGDVRAEFEEGELRAPPSDVRYEPVLLAWLRSRYSAATNNYLQERLQALELEVVEVTGKSEILEPCPCCGLRTLAARAVYAICSVCWWEDDGQDNERADVVLAGPNYELSLTQARANYLLHGISNPRRKDLRQCQDPPQMYEIGRQFSLSEREADVREIGSTWRSENYTTNGTAAQT